MCLCCIGSAHYVADLDAPSVSDKMNVWLVRQTRRCQSLSILKTLVLIVRSCSVCFAEVQSTGNKALEICVVRLLSVSASEVEYAKSFSISFFS